MFSPISASIRVLAIHLFFGFIFASLAVASHTAQSEEVYWPPAMEVATIQSAISNTDAQHVYRLSAGIAFNRPEIASPFGSEPGNPQGRSNVIDPQKNTAWTANPTWQFSPGGGSVFLSSLLRFESKTDRIEIKPKRHSVWFEWRKSFP